MVVLAPEINLESWKIFWATNGGTSTGSISRPSNWARNLAMASSMTYRISVIRPALLRA